MLELLPQPVPVRQLLGRRQVLLIEYQRRVEDEQQIFAGQVLELAHHQFAAPRGGAPVDPARAVAGPIRAKAVELVLGGAVDLGPLPDADVARVGAAQEAPQATPV